MSSRHASAGLADRRETPGRTGAYLLAATAARIRMPPTAGRIARRRWLITCTKWLLPAAALALLGTIALWPELDHTADQARFAIRNLSGTVDGGRLIDARYHGVDEKGRPYTLTAATAHQVAPERIDLTMPNGDMTLQNGTWVMLKAKRGTFIQHANQLDLTDDVTLYRDDGTTLTTASAAIDMRGGAAAGSEPVHVEGPFGILDAQGFTVLDKGATIQFTGPAHVTLNSASQ
ncbi:MAG TPA: LPS export ABC transporter periplasmic protein LptC [Acetobacteraceae bacterium]|nr:LPS export ABC transporter periplasmic protein LptC [Acetobacteraceae bacterium]